MPAFCPSAGSRNKYLIMYRIFHFHMYVCVMYMYMHVHMYVQGHMYVHGDGGTSRQGLSIKPRAPNMASLARQLALEDSLFLPFKAGTIGRLPCLSNSDVDSRNLNCESHLQRCKFTIEPLLLQPQCRLSKHNRS